MGIIKRKKSLTADTPGRTEQLSGYFYVLILLFLTIGIVAIGYFSYRTYQHNYRDQVERNISTIADQKVDELVDWRAERLGDAFIFFKNPVFTSIDFSWPIAEMVLQHHERMNGSGYPQRFKGEDILYDQDVVSAERKAHEPKRTRQHPAR